MLPKARTAPTGNLLKPTLAITAEGRRKKAPVYRLPADELASLQKSVDKLSIKSRVVPSGSGGKFTAALAGPLPAQLAAPTPASVDFELGRMRAAAGPSYHRKGTLWSNPSSLAPKSGVLRPTRSQPALAASGRLQLDPL